METASITIKLKGADALQALAGKTSLGGAKLASALPASFAKAVAAGGGEVEGGRWLLKGKPGLVGGIEIEGKGLGAATAKGGKVAQLAALPGGHAAATKPEVLAGKAAFSKAAASASVSKAAPIAASAAPKAVAASVPNTVAPALGASTTAAAAQHSSGAALSTLATAGKTTGPWKLAALGKSAAIGSGTLWSGKGLSLGLGLGLGAMGPVLLLSALGLTATGIYLYRRNRVVEYAPEPDDEPEDFVAAPEPEA